VCSEVYSLLLLSATRGQSASDSLVRAVALVKDSEPYLYILSFERAAQMAYDEKTAERVRKLLSSRPDIAEKKMMGGLCFMVRGHMCCSVSGRGGLMGRVGANAQDAALRETHVQPIEMAGRIMTGFVRIAPEGYHAEASLKAWLDRAVDFVTSLPEKSSSKPPPKRGVKDRTRP
jgi:TfoX N-terminal domain